MKLAIPEWQGRVSPVFDVAEHVWFIDLDGDDAREPVVVILGTATLHERARRLVELGVDVLVCGAISAPLEALLTRGKIRVMPLVCGEIGDVVRAFCDGTLSMERFIMPGCCATKPQRTRHRRRGRGGRAMGDTP